MEKIDIYDNNISKEDKIITDLLQDEYLWDVDANEN